VASRRGERDVPALAALLAPDSRSAPRPTGSAARAPAAQHLLGLILETDRGFTYHREWREGASSPSIPRPRRALELQGMT